MRIFMASLSIAAMAITTAQSAVAEDIKTLIKRKADGSLQKVIVPETVPYSYAVHVDVKSGEGDDSEAYAAHYRVNPQAAPGSRVTFLSGALTDFPEDFQKDIARLETEATAKDIADEFWCEDNDDDDMDLDTDDITILSENDTQAVIALGPDSLKDMMQVDTGDGGGDMPKKVLKRLTAELTVSKPDLHVRYMKVWLTKPTTIKIVAKIKEMNIEQSCEVAPNGVPYVTGHKMRVSGKALGSSFMEDAVITISDLQPL